MRPLAHLHAMAGDFDVARRLLERSNAMLADLGLSMHSAVAHYDAFVSLLAGDPPRRRPSCARATSSSRRWANGRCWRRPRACSHGRSLEQGRDDDAWAYLDIADEAAAHDDLSAHMVSAR